MSEQGFEPQTENEMKLTHLFQTYLKRAETAEIDLVIANFDIERLQAQNAQLTAQLNESKATADGPVIDGKIVD